VEAPIHTYIAQVFYRHPRPGRDSSATHAVQNIAIFTHRSLLPNTGRCMSKVRQHKQGLDATRQRPELTCKSVSSKPTTSRSISRNKSRMARWLSRPALSMPKWTVHIPAFKILARACARAGMGVGGADCLSGPTSATMAIRASVVRI
jgi:hypothetical protein